MSYAFTEEGRRWTIDALQRVRYTGPAPVTIEEFNDQVNLQKLTNELVTWSASARRSANSRSTKAFIEQSGPALNSGRAMLLYGPPGNGKTSVAHALRQRLPRCDLCALRGHCGRPDHPHPRPQHSYSAQPERK